MGLEFRNYADKPAAHFEKVGYRVGPRGSDRAPDYVAVFNYGIDDGREVVTSSEDPAYGDKDNPRRITGYETTTSSSTAYRRVITLDMYEFSTYRANQNLGEAQVYSARLISDGRCVSLAGVIDHAECAVRRFSWRERPAALHRQPEERRFQLLGRQDNQTGMFGRTAQL